MYIRVHVNTHTHEYTHMYIYRMKHHSEMRQLWFRHRWGELVLSAGNLILRRYHMENAVTGQD